MVLDDSALVGDAILVVSPLLTIRVNPKFQFHQRDPFGNGQEQQHSCCFLSGYSCGPAVDGNEHPLSARGTSGHPAGTPITPEVSLSK